MPGNDDLYEFEPGYVGRKRYVSVQGHARSIPVHKTYKGTDGLNYILPEYGGSWEGMGRRAATYVPDKAGYFSPMDGTFVEGRVAHYDHMKKHDVLEVGDAHIGAMSNNFAEKYPIHDSIRFDIRRAISELS